MLILIAGITGRLGAHLVASAIARNHSIRGLGRNPQSLQQDIVSSLESFVEIQSYDDISTIDRACRGVDAIICALSPIPKLTLDTQLLLLRAAEKAGVKIFVSSTWNYDWTRICHGDLEHYDPHIAFKRQAELTSPISPVYFFTGIFAEYVFSQLSFPVEDNQDGFGKKITYWGSPDTMIDWTSMHDAAEFTFEVLGMETVKQGTGGIFSFRSGATSPRELAATYEKVKGIKVELVCQGSETELEETALAARKGGNVRNYHSFLGYFIHLFTLRRSWSLQSLWECHRLQRTTLEEVVAMA